MASVAVFQHTPGEPLGYIEKILSDAGVPFYYNYLWETNEVPAKEATHLIFLGGPMSVNDEGQFPWLVQEKDLIRKAVNEKIPVLGLCLGAQLIAAAHGARVYRSVNEIGWCPVHRGPASDRLFDVVPDTFQVFQMHGETFEIPYGAHLLCTGTEVKNQAFRLTSALALQFHPEMTDALIADWIKGLKKPVRTKILHDSKKHLIQSNRLCRRVVRDFLGAGKAFYRK